MNGSTRRLATTLAGGLLAMFAAIPAQAALYELSWSWKWGDGRIVYEGATPDGNPHPWQGSFIGAIQSYDVGAWEYFDQTRVSGTGGSISTAATGSHHDLPCSFCGPTILTFQFGAQTLPDPTAWQLSVVIPGSAYGGGDGLPTAFDGEGLYGNLFLPSQGIQLGTISPAFGVVNKLVTPVPEPETWLLMAAGLLGLAARRRRFNAFFSALGPRLAGEPAR